MPQSIYDNGGMIGATLDFADTDRYVIGTTTAPSATSVSFVDSVVSLTTSITIPASAQAGDVAVLFHGGNAVQSTFIAPSDPTSLPGWTQVTSLISDAGNEVASAFYYKALESSDLGTTLAVSPSYENDTNMLLIFRADVAQTSEGISFVGVNSEGTTGNPVAQTINISPETDPVIALASFSATANIDSGITAPGMTAVYSEGTTNSRAIVAYDIFNSNPQNLTVDMNDEQNNILVSFGLVVSGGGVTEQFGNQKNSGIWSLSSVLESIEPFVLGDTTTVFNGAFDENSSETSYSLSVPFVDGLAVVVIHNETDDTLSPSNNRPTSVTIGGTTATMAVVADVDTPANNSVSASIWYAEVSAGTLSVDMSFTTAPYRIRIGSYSIQGYISTTPVFTGSSGSEDGDFPTSRSITTSSLNEGSSVISGFSSGDTYAHTWSGGVTEDYDGSIGSFSGATGASMKIAANGAVTITATADSTPNSANSMVLAVWQ